MQILHQLTEHDPQLNFVKLSLIKIMRIVDFSKQFVSVKNPHFFNDHVHRQNVMYCTCFIRIIHSAPINT